jgi:tetratricopeptide (TPR) repeat protein
MTRTAGHAAVELLITESRTATEASRYRTAQDAADRAVAGAERLGDAVLLVRAIAQQQLALRMAGDFSGALVCCTRILAMAEDPATREALGTEAAAATIARAYMYWVTAARTDARADLRELLAMLDTAEHWLIRTGHGHWRSGVLSERSDIYRALGERGKALECAQEALSRYAPGIPGFSLSVYRWSVGRLLSEAGRYGEAEGYLQAVLDDHDSLRLDRVTAHVWLSYNAVDDGRPQDAARAAAAAVALAESCGDDAMTTALDAQCFALRRAGDWAGARAAAQRHLAAARRAGGRARIYHALDSMAWTAAGSEDFSQLRGLFPELEGLASTLDEAQGVTWRTDRFCRLRERLPENAPG